MRKKRNCTTNIEILIYSTKIHFLEVKNENRYTYYKMKYYLCYKDNLTTIHLKMAMYLTSLIAFTALILIPDLWFFMKMKKHHFYPWFRLLSLVPGFLFILSFFYIRFGLVYNTSYQVTAGVSWILFAFSVIYTPKVLYIVFYYFNHSFNRIFNAKTRIFRIIGFALSVYMVTFLFYGAVVTRDDFYLKTQYIYVDELPRNFDGYKIAVFADLHLGNWNNRYKIMEPIITLLNEGKPDIIVFGGDLINNYENETVGWEPYFRRLKARQGMYAVLGNHDYGDYTKWKTKEEKEENLDKTKRNIRNLGFRLLLNEHVELVKGSDTITLAGVENYGSGHFENHGDLTAALKGTRPERKKILISHDPNQWDEEIATRKKDIFLTLSGHTHAGQIGISNRKIHFSPAAIIYPKWDGLYSHGNQYLYVNRGAGYVGIPLRLGVPPEITLIVLKRKK